MQGCAEVYYQHISNFGCSVELQLHICANDDLAIGSSHQIALDEFEALLGTLINTGCQISAVGILDRFNSARVINPSLFLRMFVPQSMVDRPHPWNHPNRSPQLMDFHPSRRVTGSTSMYRNPWISIPIHVKKRLHERQATLPVPKVEQAGSGHA